MHVLLGSTKGSARVSAEVAALHALADDVFTDGNFLRYGDLLATLKSTLKCSDSTAERRFNALKQHKVIARFPPNLWGKAA